MVKAVFFDIDGTLLSFHTHKVSPGTVEAFSRLHAKGIKTLIASGRPAVLIPPMPIEFDGYVTVNGGYCYVSDTVVCNNPIPQEESRRWLEYVEANGLVTMAFLRHEMYINRVDEAVLALQAQLGFDMPGMKHLEELREREVYQFIAMMPASRDAEVQALLPHCRLPRWHNAFSDLVNATSNKAVGIQRVIEHLGLRREETMAFGDGANDIEMLQYAGIGVAMGNADPKVQAQADYVTASADDEGILKALEHFGVI